MLCRSTNRIHALLAAPTTTICFSTCNKQNMLPNMLEQRATMETRLSVVPAFDSAQGLQVFAGVFLIDDYFTARFSAKYEHSCVIF